MLRISVEPLGSLEGYCEVSIGFESVSRLELGALRGGRFVEIPAEPTWKDYDKLESPLDLVTHFETSNWARISAWSDSERVGGAIVARDTPEFDMLLGRNDLAVIADIRVAPTRRGCGIGRLLFYSACEYAKSQGCIELHVETQETNVAACRFYFHMGCKLVRVEEEAYGPSVDEAKLVWGRTL